MPKSTEVAKATDAVEFPISSDQTLKASKALLSHLKKTTKETAAKSSKKNLLDEADDEGSGSLAEAPIWLAVTTKRHIRDSNKLKPGRIALPHALNKDAEATICLIVADPQRAYKDIVASDEFPAELGKRITRVVDLQHLQAKFRTYEAQRKLFSEHDFFLADDRVINRLPKALGKTFYKTTTKRPIPVVLSGKKAGAGKDKAGAKRKPKSDEDKVNARPAADIAKEIEAALSAALVHLTPSTQTTIKVGFAAWSAKQVAENAEAVARALVERHVPGKWQGVKSVFLRGSETVSLPIWQTEELWLDADKDVLAEGSEELKALEAKKEAKREKEKEKANIGKKRKIIDIVAVDDAEEGVKEEEEEAAPVAKKAKKEKKVKARKEVPEGNDDKLDQQIKERKAALKKQKKAAKKAIDA